MLVGVGVADHGRVLPRLPHHGQTVGRIRPGRGAAVRPAAPGAGRRGAGTVAAQHQTVEIKPDLEISKYFYKFYKIFLCNASLTWQTEGSLLVILYEQVPVVV